MYVRVVRFTDVTAERVEGTLARIKESDGPPPGVPATGLRMMFDESQGEQLSRVVDEEVKHQAATFSSVLVVLSSVTLIPSLNFTPSSTSVTSSWPLNRRQRSWAASKSL